MTTRNANANTGVPRLCAPRSARNDGERQRQIQGFLVLRLAALAQVDGEKAKANTGVLRLAALAQDDGGVGDDSQDLCNPGQRMGAITRRMGLAPLAASFGRGGGRWREAFATRYPTESEGDRL